MEGKKISFGFMKTKKVEKPILEEKRDYIECVEEKSIRVVGGEEVIDNTPLVIPMKPNTLVTAERLKEIAEKVESALEEPEPETKVEPPSPSKDAQSNETLDQMAVRELIEGAKKEVKVETQALTVPLPAKPVNEGEKESTLDDYEAVPIQDFGLAMLRGMGWTAGSEKSKYKPPQLRPKGLGLGADKVIKDNQKKQKSNKDGKEELTIVKNAFVKITSGKYSGYYGRVMSLDEDNGRVMVDITVKKETVSVSEFMMHPVTKAEYDKESKVINSESYEEYKKKETTQKSSKNTDRESNPGNSAKDRNRENRHDREATSSKNDRYDRNDKSKYTDKDRSSKNGKEVDTRSERDRDRTQRSKQRRDSREQSEERYRRSRKYSSDESLDSLSDTDRRKKKKERKRYSSQDSLSSESDGDRKRNKKKERKRRDSSDSDSDRRSKTHKNPEGKRDIDKKRKGKKKKRDRDRSPNYRKHRK